MTNDKIEACTECDWTGTLIVAGVDGTRRCPECGEEIEDDDWEDFEHGKQGAD